MMDNKAFAKELEKRTRKFAVEIIHLSSKRNFSMSPGNSYGFPPPRE